jgi:ankyrin repeat protein
VYYLTSWPVNINLPDNDGHYTPLHLGVISGNAKVVRRLLIKGADITIKDKNRKTASDLAKMNEFGNIYEMIVLIYLYF